MGQVSSFMMRQLQNSVPRPRGGEGARRPTRCAAALQLLMMLCMVGATMCSAYAMPIGLRIAIMGRAAERQQVAQVPAELLDAFAGLPVAIEPDGEGGWKVTITSDVDAANLPIVIPDNIGHVTIDLNGHDLIGGDGRDGARPSQDAGEDGKSAIRIVPGEGDGEPTVLTVVTTGGDAIVKGGEGGAGNPGGNGAPGIKVTDGAQDGVLINIGAGVTVQGVPAIDGTIGENNGNIVNVEEPVPATIRFGSDLWVCDFEDCRIGNYPVEQEGDIAAHAIWRGRYDAAYAETYEEASSWLYFPIGFPAAQYDSSPYYQTHFWPNLKFIEYEGRNDCLWFSPFPVTEDKKFSSRFVPAGRPLFVDALLTFPANEDVLVDVTMPEVSGSTSTAGSQMTAPPGHVLLGVWGNSMAAHIDDKIMVYQDVATNSWGDVSGTNWIVRAGFVDDSGSLVERKAVLRAADAGAFLPSIAIREWARFTVKAFDSGTPHGIAFEIYLNGVRCEAEGCTAFFAMPGATDRTGVSALGLHGNGCADNIVFSTISPEFIPDETFGVESCETVYDGCGHGISIAETDPADAVVKYALSADGPYSEAPILFTNATEGAVDVWYTVEAANYATVTNSGTVKISPKTLTEGMVELEESVFVHDGTAKEPGVSVKDGEPSILTENDYDIVYSNNVDAGVADVIVTGKGNYEGGVTMHFVIKSAEETALHEIFDDLPAVVEPDGDGGWKVTITNDIDSADLPLEIPDNIGNVTIDLNGHDLIGRDGARPSQDAGMPAIVIVPGGGGGTPTQIAIVSTGGDAVVKGGNGADAIEVADGANEDVKVDVGAGVAEVSGKVVRRVLWQNDEQFQLAGAAQYDGYLLDPEAGDAVAGTIQVKAGKPNKKNGVSKLSVTVLVAGRKKATAKGTTSDGTFQGTADGMAIDITLGFSSITGKVGRYVVDGARNVFTAKDADSKIIAAQALKKWQGVYTVAWKAGAAVARDARPYQTLSLEVKAKGKVKVAGTLLDGTKVSANSQLLVGERECAIAVSWTKKGASVACLVWLKEDGTVECGNLPGGAQALIANLRAGAKLEAGAALRVDPAAIAASVPGLLEELLPDGLAIRMKGTAFDVDKPGKVSLLKDKSGVDASKAGTNPSGLKLKYTIKNGVFKGSFTAYSLSGGKLKKTKVGVGGVVIGGKGYGAASVKKVGAWELRIEN